jgi:hypothetical protein
VIAHYYVGYRQYLLRLLSIKGESRRNDEEPDLYRAPRGD